MNNEQLMQVLIAPRISEKSTRVADIFKQFVFHVMKDATKADIKRAAELMFNVKVASVQVSNVKGKTKSFRKKSGRRPDMKKAYIRLEPGFDIDYMGPE